MWCEEVAATSFSRYFPTLILGKYSSKTYKTLICFAPHTQNLPSLLSSLTKILQSNVISFSFNILSVLWWQTYSTVLFILSLEYPFQWYFSVWRNITFCVCVCVVGGSRGKWVNWSIYIAIRCSIHSIIHIPYYVYTTIKERLFSLSIPMYSTVMVLYAIHECNIKCFWLLITQLRKLEIREGFFFIR